MKDSKIGWTDHTLNPVRGCQLATFADGSVSPACMHCYAADMSVRFQSKNPDKVNILGSWGPTASRYRAEEKYLNQALRWNQEAKETGIRKRVFCASLADMFEGETREGKEQREGVRKDYLPILQTMWILMEKTPFLDWLWLTKRPWNMVQYLKEHGTPEHFWAGTTVENQMAAEERIPFLLHCTKAKVRFLSMEPLLEKVLFRREWLDRYVDYPVGSTCHHYRHGDRSGDMESKINWIIIGAESLQKRPGRPMQATWVQTYVDLCACFGIPLFVKQGDVNGIISDSYLVKVGEEERLIKEIPEG